MRQWPGLMVASTLGLQPPWTSWTLTWALPERISKPPPALTPPDLDSGPFHLNPHEHGLAGQASSLASPPPTLGSPSYLGGQRTLRMQEGVRSQRFGFHYPVRLLEISDGKARYCTDANGNPLDANDPRGSHD